MSSTFPPSGDRTLQLCQRCRTPLAPDNGQCGRCGYYNALMPGNNAAAQTGNSSASMPVPQGSPAPGQFKGLLKGTSLSTSSAQRAVPPLVRPGQPGNVAPAAMPGPSNNGSIATGNFLTNPSAARQPVPGNFAAPPSQVDMTVPRALNTGLFPTHVVTPQQSGMPTGFPTNPPASQQVNYFAPTGFPANPPVSQQPGMPTGFPTNLSGAWPASTPNPIGGPGAASGYSGYPGMQPGNAQAGPASYGASSAQGQGMGFQPPFPAASMSQEKAQFTEERRSGNKAFITIVVVLVVLLLGGSAYGGYYYFTHMRPANTQTAPGSYPIPKASAQFSASFDKANSQQWNLPATGTGSKYAATMGNGSLLLEDDENKVFPLYLPNAQTFGDLKLIVNASLTKGDQANGYGVYLRGALDQNGNITTYYCFELYGDGTYAIFKGETDANGKLSRKVLVNYTADPAIQKAGSVNQLVLIAQGGAMTLIVNGQSLKTITDTSYVSGVVGLFVSNPDQVKPGAQASFSRLAIYAADAK